MALVLEYTKMTSASSSGTLRVETRMNSQDLPALQIKHIAEFDVINDATHRQITEQHDLNSH